MKKSVHFFLLVAFLLCFFPGGMSCQKTPTSNKPTVPLIIPEKEDGLHDAEIEWWYHFGLLKEKGSTEFQYSFLSSFQRNKRGRNLFFALADLKTGKVFFSGEVDKSVMYGSPFLPKGYKFLQPPKVACPAPRSELWLCYGENNLHKQDSTTYMLTASADSFELHLVLEKDGPPMLVMGNGMMGIKKTEDAFYYSYPRMKPSGHLKIGNKELDVEGEFWYDHQWGELVMKWLKWAWWGFKLDNNQNINVYFIQDAVTNKVIQKGLTIQYADGKTGVFTDLEFTPRRRWKSPDSGRNYITGWEINAPTLGIKLAVEPITDHHELPALVYGKIWEGPCKVELTNALGEKVSGRGFQEIIGKIKSGISKK